MREFFSRGHLFGLLLLVHLGEMKAPPAALQLMHTVIEQMLDEENITHAQAAVLMHQFMKNDDPNGPFVEPSAYYTMLSRKVDDAGRQCIALERSRRSKKGAAAAAAAASTTNPTMPDIETFFKRFAHEHSWYKHCPMPREFGIALRPINGELVWVSYLIEDVLDRSNQRWPAITNEVMREAVRANTFLMNGLVYNQNHGFNHTVGIGGNEWFAWLESMYPEDAKLIKKHSKPLEKSAWQFNEWSFSLFDLPNEERNAVERQIRALKAKEYARVLADFKVKAEQIWKVYVTTIDNSKVAPEKSDKPAPLRTGYACIVCATSPAKRCGKCIKVAYCGVACQRADYQKHKNICETPSEQKARNTGMRDKANANSPLMKYLEAHPQRKQMIQATSRDSSFNKQEMIFMLLPDEVKIVTATREALKPYVPFDDAVDAMLRAHHETCHVACTGVVTGLKNGDWFQGAFDIREFKDA